jgi:uncharacterized protein YajQ (UPF0234 family)
MPQAPVLLPAGGYLGTMPTFDVVSQVDMQEVRNAVDQAQRELANRFDFKGTDSTVELSDTEIKLASSTEDRLKAVIQVLEEKLVKRKVSLKVLDWGKIEDGSRGAVRQSATLKNGLTPENSKAINRFIKEKGAKGISSSSQGEQVRVNGKKRDDLQGVIAALREEDFGIPLQFENFRD